MGAKAYKSNVTSSDFLNFYKEHSEFNSLKRGNIRKCLDFIFTEIINKIIFEGYEYNMPSKLGSILILKKKITPNKDNLTKYYPTDYKATKDLWASNPEAKEKRILIKHLNRHTNGYLMKIHYNKFNAMYKNKTVYQFIPARYTFKRKLNKALVEHGNKLNFYEPYIKYK